MAKYEPGKRIGPMTYSEYRAQFNSVEEFKRAFGKLTESEVRLLIASDNAPTFVKAAMMDAWKKIVKEVKR